MTRIARLVSSFLRSVAINAPLQLAKKTKNDEFYTKYEDIEKELPYYWGQLKGKVIYCNCDSPESNFVKYFINNFHAIGIKKLIATHYIKDDMVSTAAKPQKLIMTKGGTTLSRLRGDGDFRSEECIDILSECDMVITNPPFTIINDFFTLVRHKKILFIAPLASLSNVIILRRVLNGAIWTGVNPDVKKFYCDGKERIVGCTWITNIDNGIYPCLPLVKQYNHNEYPRYDEYDAINVSKTKNIPMDYYGKMGVPISFFNRHNPHQFTILDSVAPHIGGKKLFQRFIIKRNASKKIPL